MQKLRYKTFAYNHVLCDFVNDNKVTVQQIVFTGDHYVLFYWREEK